MTEQSTNIRKKAKAPKKPENGPRTDEELLELAGNSKPTPWNRFYEEYANAYSAVKGNAAAQEQVYNRFNKTIATGADILECIGAMEAIYGVTIPDHQKVAWLKEMQYMTTKAMYEAAHRAVTVLRSFPSLSDMFWTEEAEKAARATRRLRD